MPQTERLEVLATLIVGLSGSRGTANSLTSIGDRQGGAAPTVAERQINDGRLLECVPDVQIVCSLVGPDFTPAAPGAFERL
jgi:hypothetical protein